MGTTMPNLEAEVVSQFTSRSALSLDWKAESYHPAPTSAALSAWAVSWPGGNRMARLAPVSLLARDAQYSGGASSRGMAALLSKSGPTMVQVSRATALDVMNACRVTPTTEMARSTRSAYDGSNAVGVMVRLRYPLLLF